MRLNYPAPRVILISSGVTLNQLRWIICTTRTEHRTHKRLNNRVEHAHQQTRRKEKILIEFKHPNAVQRTLSLMGKVRNIFAVNVGRYTTTEPKQRLAFASDKSMWDEATQRVLAA